MPEITPPAANPTAASADEAGSGDLASSLMADLTGQTPPAAPSTPPATPEPGAAQPTPPEKKEAPAPAPEKKPAQAAPPAPEKKQQPAPPAQPAKKTINPDDPKVTATELRNHLKEVIANSQQTVAQKEAEMSKLNTRLGELEKKRFWTENDEKLNQTMTQRLAQLESDLYGRDYASSPEYKKLYADKINEQGQEAFDVFKALSVKFMDGDEEKTRPGEWRDLMRMYNAPNGAERRKIAKELFGPDFQEALDVVNPMVQTNKAAAQAIKDKTASYQSETQQRAQQMQAQNGQIQTFIGQQTEALAKQFPDIFSAADDNPDASAALKKGFSFVDESTSKQGMSLNERAARAALIRSWAGAFPRLLLDLNKSRAEVSRLTEELKKYQAKDPSNAGETGGDGGGGGGAKDGGSSDLADEIEAMNRR